MSTQIELFRLMDFTYYQQDFILEIYLGQLLKRIHLREEVDPLEWLPLTEDFTRRECFAGD